MGKVQLRKLLSALITVLTTELPAHTYAYTHIHIHTHIHTHTDTQSDRVYSINYYAICEFGFMQGFGLFIVGVWHFCWWWVFFSS